MSKDLLDTATDALLKRGEEAATKAVTTLADQATGGATSAIVGIAKWFGRQIVSTIDNKMAVVESVKQNVFHEDEQLSAEALNRFRAFAIAIGPAFRRLEDIGVDTAPLRQRFGLRWYSAVSCAIDVPTIRRFLEVQKAGKAAFSIALDDLAGSVELTAVEFPVPEDPQQGALRAYKVEFARAIFETSRKLRSTHPQEAKSILKSVASSDVAVAGELIARCIHLTEAEFAATKEALRTEGTAGGPRKTADIVVKGIQTFRSAAADLRAIAAGVPKGADATALIGKFRAVLITTIADHLELVESRDKAAFWREALGPMKEADAVFTEELQAVMTVRDTPTVPLPPPAAPQVDAVKNIITDSKEQARKDAKLAIEAFQAASRDLDPIANELVVRRLRALDQALDSLRWSVPDAIMGRKAVHAIRDDVIIAGGQAIAAMKQADKKREAGRLLSALEMTGKFGERWQREVEMAAETAEATDRATRQIGAEREKPEVDLVDIDLIPSLPPF